MTPDEHWSKVRASLESMRAHVVARRALEKAPKLSVERLRYAWLLGETKLFQQAPRYAEVRFGKRLPPMFSFGGTDYNIVEKFQL